MELGDAEYLIDNQILGISDTAIIVVKYVSKGKKMLMYTLVTPGLFDDIAVEAVVGMMLRKEKVCKITSVKLRDYMRDWYEDN